MTQWTRNILANDHREITPKMCKAELWFLDMTHSLIRFYNCMKFHPNTLKNFQLTEWRQNCIYLCSNENNLKKNKQKKQARVMVLVHSMLYQCALQMYDSSSKYI